MMGAALIAEPASASTVTYKNFFFIDHSSRTSVSLGI